MKRVRVLPHSPPNTTQHNLTSTYNYKRSKEKRKRGRIVSGKTNKKKQKIKLNCSLDFFQFVLIIHCPSARTPAAGY